MSGWPSWPPAAGAATWGDLPLPKSSEIYGLTVSRGLPGLAWATVSGPQVMVTRDAGASWALFALTDGLVTKVLTE